MRAISIRRICVLGTSLVAIAASAPAFAEDAADAAAYDSADAADAIVVTGQRTTYNNAALDETLIDDKSPIASAIDLIGTLPGVQVNEGDAFGFDDWSTTYSIRGYQTNLDTQQVGLTIDGLPNGGSGYGGGSKANRFIDTANIGTVEVFQGTADIASRSNEALGGTINFVTADPIDDMRVRLSGSVGDYDASRYYGRFDTGLIGGVAKAWFSYGHQQATDWMEGSAKNHRDNFAMKFIVDTPVKFTGYASYDDAFESNYDQVYSQAQYDSGAYTDGLVGVWTGVPVADQQYRQVWNTKRKNFFAYLKAETKIANAIDLKASVYYHDMAGRGDWAPPTSSTSARTPRHPDRDRRHHHCPGHACMVGYAARRLGHADLFRNQRRRPDRRPDRSRRDPAAVVPPYALPQGPSRRHSRRRLDHAVRRDREHPARRRLVRGHPSPRMARLAPRDRHQRRPGL